MEAQFVKVLPVLTIDVIGSVIAFGAWLGGKLPVESLTARQLFLWQRCLEESRSQE